MSPNKALLIGNLAHAHKEWQALSSIATLVQYPEDGSREDFLSKCRSGEFDGVKALYRSNDSNKITGNFNKELVDVLPESLKYICHNGAGYDNIEVDACTKRGISVSSTPVAVNDATADVAIFLMLGALRRITPCWTAIREGKWRGGSKFQLGHDPKGKVLGILGMGGIGKAVATRAKAFGMHIQYNNRSKLPSSEENGAEYVSFEELLKSSDVLSLNLALNPSTRHIISTPQFEMMKKGVTVINTGRGPLIDEEALVKALEDGIVWSCGLDVYEREPEVHEKLLSNENIVLLPHVGTATVETQYDMEVLVIDNIKEAIQNGKLLTQIPEQKNGRGA